eukprot:m.131558 g.131558  ORF g.131558 m.131558 type:complete len:343 (-) comp29555_c0_seq1:48-1076(-)
MMSGPIVAALTSPTATTAFAIAIASATAILLGRLPQGTLGRKDKPTFGEIIKLSTGNTRYVSEASDDEHDHEKQVVVMVHGAGTPLEVFDSLAAHFVLLGFRVLRYDLPGRGWTDAPDGRQSVPSFVEHLAELLTALNITTQVDLIGFSFGGAVVSEFVLRYPTRVNRLCYFAPVVTEPATSPIMSKLFFIDTVCGRILFNLLGSTVGLKAIAVGAFKKQVSNWGNDCETFAANVVADNALNNPAFLRSFIFTIEEMVASSLCDSSHGFSAKHKAAHDLNIRQLFFFGRDDGLISINAAQTMIASVPNADCHVIDHHKHYFLIDKELLRSTIFPLLTKYFTL